jgi:hypothetical protein
MRADRILAAIECKRLTYRRTDQVRARLNRKQGE